MRTFSLFSALAVLALGSTASGAITNPTDISGLSLWLDASDSGSITHSGGQVSQWNDKSGLGNHFVQGTASNRPITGGSSVNGLNTLSFSGTQHFTGPSAILTAGDDDYTYFAIWNSTTTSGFHSVYEQGSTGSRRSAILTGGSSYGFNGESNDLHNLVPFTANSWRVTDMEINNPGPNNVRIYDNGNYFSGNTSNPATLNINDNGTAVGKKVNVTGEYFQGQIAEVVVYDRALTNAERADVANYLNNKYAFSNTVPGIVHRWSFNDGTADDSIGTADGTLFNGATVSGGQLQLDGINDYVRTSTIDNNIGAKTLVAWVTPDNLDQRSGSVLTLENPAGSDVFDGIVYGEQTAGQWMNGSDFFNRTVAGNGGAIETLTSEIMMAIVYEADNSITLYRNGVLYANADQGTLQNYPGGIADVLLGLRHVDIASGTGSANGNDAFWAGLINEARIYNVALTDAEIAQLFQLGPDLLEAPPPQVPEPASVLLWGMLAAGVGVYVRRRRKK